jgi:hypothetical protein
MTAMICLAAGIWQGTLEHLRRCGQGRRECAVLWTGPLDSPTLIDAALHPDHSATPWNYRLEQRWLDRLHLGLLRERRTIRAQVHTHKGAAFHSATDDRFPAVSVAGFVSLVLPGFALGAMTEDQMWLAELGKDGQWRRVPVGEQIEGLQ